MSESTKTVVATVTQLATIMAMSIADIVKFTAQRFVASRVAYAEAAKGIIAVTQQLTARYKKSPEPKRVFAELSKGGVSESDFRNGSQLAGLWPLIVETGLISESAFDQITFPQAGEVRTVIRRETKTERGLPAALPPETAKLVQKLLTGQRDELTCHAENGCSVKEFAKRVAKLEASAKAEAAKTATAATGTPASGEAETPAADTPATGETGNTTKAATAPVVPMNAAATRFADLKASIALVKNLALQLVSEGNAATNRKVVEELVALAQEVGAAAKAAKPASAPVKPARTGKVAKAA